MKKIITVTLLAFSLMLGSALAATVSVSRTMPNRVDPKGTLTVSFSTSPSESISGFDLVEYIPQVWSIKDWSISGYEKADVTFESPVKDYGGKTYKANHWKFGKEFSRTVTLTYTIDVPVSSGDFEFIGLWTYPGGFSSDSKSFSVAAAPTTTMPTCPACPSPTTWSECVADKQTRTNYRCSAETNYECEAYTEEQICEAAKPPTVPEMPMRWVTAGAVIATSLILLAIVVWRNWKKMVGTKKKKR